jgi:hypothetical protein
MVKERLFKETHFLIDAFAIIKIPKNIKTAPVALARTI